MPPGADEYLLTLARSLAAAGDTRRALAVLDLAASRDSGRADALSLKGDLLRARGDLRAAAGVFELLARQHPDHPRAEYLSALLCGTAAPLQASGPAPWPAAFVRLEDFLDPARRDELLEFVTSRTEAFEPSTVGSIGVNGRQPRVDLAVRLSFRLVDVDPILSWLRPLIAACIEPVGARLGIAPFRPAMIELKCTAYGDGSFFRVHSDSLNHPTRRISFIYYFHRLPKRYAGGALVLYDGDPADPSQCFREAATRLDTLDNSLVCFPSGAYHEVTPVVSPSGRLVDARFTFAGHVHVAEEAPVGFGEDASAPAGPTD